MVFNTTSEVTSDILKIPKQAHEKATSMHSLGRVQEFHDLIFDSIYLPGNQHFKKRAYYCVFPNPVIEILIMAPLLINAISD